MAVFSPYGKSLQGSFELPGDKSIAQRALIISRIAQGSEGLIIDNLPNASAVQACSAALDELDKALAQGESCPVIHCGNSATAARLICGLLMYLGVEAIVDGNAQLRRRPMARICEPLRIMGADIQGEHLPLHLRPNSCLSALDYRMPVASAQLKSCLLLAAMAAEAESRIIEPAASRDHTERMLACMGVPVNSRLRSDGSVAISIRGPVRPDASALPRLWHLPSDPSSAAFLAVSAALLPGSDLSFSNLCLNPARIAFAEILKGAGVDISWELKGECFGEPVGCMRVRCPQKRPLYQSIHVAAQRVPALIDELPLLVLFSSVCEGKSVFSSLSELRFKESDRLAALARGMEALGCSVLLAGDEVQVSYGPPCRDCSFDSQDDHRMAMVWALSGLCFDCHVEVLDFEASIARSFPEFPSFFKL